MQVPHYFLNKILSPVQSFEIKNKLTNISVVRSFCLIDEEVHPRSNERDRHSQQYDAPVNITVNNKALKV